VNVKDENPYAEWHWNSLTNRNEGERLHWKWRAFLAVSSANLGPTSTYFDFAPMPQREAGLDLRSRFACRRAASPATRTYCGLKGRADPRKNQQWSFLT
jgi:hypothetical protein